ncbi:hypothetical protein CLOM_g7301 [Closterium sp. NIES-68]|nr:hypothetical protein CLOM_g7301 [Closterium sp. NIES-68]GJP81286.1 hypothetical protein CLOP_g11443 [Closterium sp. NIES-67]
MTAPSSKCFDEGKFPSSSSSSSSFSFTRFRRLSASHAPRKPLGRRFPAPLRTAAMTGLGAVSLVAFVAFVVAAIALVPLPSHAAIPAAAAAAAAAVPLHRRVHSRRLQSTSATTSASRDVAYRANLESRVAAALTYSLLDDSPAAGQSGAATRRRMMAGTLVVGNETILLVPDRTARRDPLNGLRTYSGGWNPTDSHYWASVGFTVSFGPLIGVAWLLLGLGIVFGVCCTCCCCHERWSRMRSHDYRPYTKKDLTLPLVLMIVGLVGLVVGIALMLAGGIMFRSTMLAITDHAMEQVDRVAGIVSNVSTAVAALSSTHVANAALPTNITSNVTAMANQVNQTAVEMQGLLDQGSFFVNTSVLLIYRFMFGVGMTIALLCALGFVFALLRIVVVTNIILFFLWFSVFWAWIATGIFFTTYIVEGDSVAALQQVMLNPSVNSAMSRYLPCANHSDMQSVLTTARSALFTSQTFIKSALEDGYPQVLQAAGASSVCVPYAPPQYTPNPSICEPGSLTLTQLSKKLNQSGGSGLPPEVVSDLTAVLANTERLEGTLDSVQTILDCAYIKNVAQFIIDQAFKLESNLRLVWVGFLVLAVACMLFSGAMPTYAFRASRLMPDGKADGLYVAQPVPY